MFHPCAEPLLLSEAGIHGLCVSLNTPILNIEQLPVGPARAAIVLFDDGWGRLSLGVGVRSIEKRRVALFSYQGGIEADLEPSQAMEAAQGFAEGMGFLFDDDLVASDPSEGRSRALRIWAELTDTGDLPEPELEPEPEAPEAHTVPPLSPAVPLLSEDEELVLDDLAGVDPQDLLLEEDLTEVAPPDLEIALEKAVPPGPPAAPPAPPAAPAVSLSRFRQPPTGAAPGARPAAGPEAVCGAAEPAAAEPATRKAAKRAGNALGRIALVRQKKREAGDREASLLLRILGSF